jgi:hypothetical protein
MATLAAVRRVSGRRTDRGDRRYAERPLGRSTRRLRADTFAVYNRPRVGPNVIRTACRAKSRRKSREARTTAPLPAHEASARIRRLCRVEEVRKDLLAEMRPAIRQRDAVLLLFASGEQFEEQGRRVLPYSPIGRTTVPEKPMTSVPLPVTSESVSTAAYDHRVLFLSGTWVRPGNEFGLRATIIVRRDGSADGSIYWRAMRVHGRAAHYFATEWVHGFIKCREVELEGHEVDPGLSRDSYRITAFP